VKITRKMRVPRVVFGGRRLSQWTAREGGSRGDATGMDAEEIRRPFISEFQI
jgi:hypothetical protein